MSHTHTNTHWNTSSGLEQALWLTQLFSIILYNQINSTHIKKDTFDGSVLMRWMKLEPIIQSEVRKKNTNTVY